MQKTIDWLVKSKQPQNLSKLMGDGLDWEKKETSTEDEKENGISYYKLN